MLTTSRGAHPIRLPPRRGPSLGRAPRGRRADDIGMPYLGVNTARRRDAPPWRRRPRHRVRAIGGFLLPQQTDEARTLLGLVPQEIAVYDVLSPRRNLSFFGALYGLRGADLARRVDGLLAGVNLADRADQAIYTFSGGMQRRVNIAAA